MRMRNGSKLTMPPSLAAIAKYYQDRTSIHIESTFHVRGRLLIRQLDDPLSRANSDLCELEGGEEVGLNKSLFLGFVLGFFFFGLTILS